MTGWTSEKDDKTIATRRDSFYVNWIDKRGNQVKERREKWTRHSAGFKSLNKMSSTVTSTFFPFENLPSRTFRALRRPFQPNLSFSVPFSFLFLIHVMSFSFYHLFLLALSLSLFIPPPSFPLCQKENVICKKLTCQRHYSFRHEDFCDFCIFFLNYCCGSSSLCTTNNCLTIGIAT